jgi:hypothetical protein
MNLNSYENLSEISLDKLIKLRDVALDDIKELFDEYQAMQQRLTEINIQISLKQGK